MAEHSAAHGGDAMAADPALAVDDSYNDADSSLGDDVASSTASLASSILEHRRENGRTYHKYKDGSYHFPNDEIENERLDLQHHIFYLTLDGKLGLSPPNNKETKVGRVLDLGTGTGIWAMDYGDEHPESEVLGIDLSPTQPSFVPPNVSFQIDDFEDTWTYSQPFDYIHSRMMNFSVADWSKYIKNCFDHIQPGGYLEVQEFTVSDCDDGTLKPESALYRAMALLVEAAAKLGHPFVDLSAIKPMMIEAGFEDVVEVRYKWASNQWPRDRRHKEIGLWNNENICSGLQGFLMAALTRGLGWSKEEVDVLSAQARLDVSNRAIHAYWPIFVVYGRKPEAPKAA